MKKLTLAKYIFIVALALSPYLIVRLVAPTHYLYALIVPFLLFSLLIFNSMVGKFVWSKPYFMSPYNLMSAKVRHKEEFDLPKQLLFEKLMEVIPVIGFKIKHSDEMNGNIFANKSISWPSYGENIYISLTEVNDKTTLDFCSASIFSGFAFNLSEERNERNYKDLIHEFEKSLVI
jgi:hypothetical protein